MKSIHYSLIALFCGLFSHVEADEKPAKLESLTTTKNRTYQKVEIREVTPAGIKILHESGTATIPYEVLPETVQKQLGGFDPAKAESYRMKEAEASRGQEQALEKASPPVPMPVAPQADPFAVPDTPPAGSGAPIAEAAPKQPVKDKGILAARIVGYRTGIKRVEFKVRTNCAATLEVHQVIPDEHSPNAHTDKFTVAPNTNFVREIWVYNNYSADLFNQKGEPLDKESTDRKTGTGGLTRPTLR